MQFFGRCLFTVCCILIADSSGKARTIKGQEGEKMHHHHYHNDHHHHPRWGPFFEEFSNTTTSKSTVNGFYALVAAVGDSVRLNCRVAMLQDKLVMWVKKTADRVSLLTVGSSLYSSDPRFHLKFQYPNNWRLEISPILKGDEGLYMCQVSTHPPKVLYTNLTVISPELSIVDENGNSLQDRFYQIGSKIELICTAVITTNELHIVKKEFQLSWTKDNKTFVAKLKNTSYNSTDYQRTFISRLIIAQADSSDSGTFTCQLSKHVRNSVHVHVVNGENQAAVYYESSAGNNIEKPVLFFIILIVTHFL